MPTDQDRHTLQDASGLPDAVRRRIAGRDDEENAPLRAFLQRNSGEQAARYVPLPRLIQE